MCRISQNHRVEAIAESSIPCITKRLTSAQPTTVDEKKKKQKCCFLFIFHVMKQKMKFFLFCIVDIYRWQHKIATKLLAQNSGEILFLHFYSTLSNILNIDRTKVRNRAQPKEIKNVQYEHFKYLVHKFSLNESTKKIAAQSSSLVLHISKRISRAYLQARKRKRATEKKK